jgi:hypothetical protein
VTKARSYQVALEVVAPRSPGARTAQCIIEVASVTGASAAPLVGNPAVLQTFTAETISKPAAPGARASQVAVEVISRSDLGATPLPSGTPAILQTLSVEALSTAVPAVRASQVGVEVVSRSGLGRDPLVNNPALLEGITLEVVSFNFPGQGGGPGNPPGGGHACDCVITPQPPPFKYLMRRPGRFK